MKLRASFFDKATFRKDLTRYWPVWLLYTLLLFAVLLPYMNFDKYDMFILPENMNLLLSDMAIYEMVYAGLVAALLFGDLCSKRSCYMLHAMPATRTARFVSHICSGLLACLIPHLLIALLWLPTFTPWGLWFIPLCFFGAISLQYLCFFGIAVFAVMGTGNRFAMAILYGILNFLSRFLNVFMSIILLPKLHGLTETYDHIVNLLSPVTQLQYNNDYLHYTWTGYPEYSTFDAFGDSWAYTFILAGVGVALLLLSYGMYRRRKLEAAGDFIAAPWLKPVFLVLFTLCTGAFACKSDLVKRAQEQIPLMIGGMVIGFFSGKMLLERTFKIFRLKSFLQFAALAAACVLAVSLSDVCAQSVVDYVPETEEIASVTYSGDSRESYEFVAKERIETVQSLHRWILEKNCDKRCGNNHSYFEITYTLKNGKTVSRSYSYSLCCTEETETARTQLLLWTKYSRVEDLRGLHCTIDGDEGKYTDTLGKKAAVYQLHLWILETQGDSCDGNCGNEHITLSLSYGSSYGTDDRFTYQLCLTEETEDMFSIIGYFKLPYEPNAKKVYSISCRTYSSPNSNDYFTSYKATEEESIGVYLQVYQWAKEHACDETCGSDHFTYAVSFYLKGRFAGRIEGPHFTFSLCDNEESRAMIELLKTYATN